MPMSPDLVSTVQIGVARPDMGKQQRRSTLVLTSGCSTISISGEIDYFDKKTTGPADGMHQFLLYHRISLPLPRTSAACRINGFEFVLNAHDP